MLPFHSLTEEWFAARFGRPTEPQARAWPELAAGRDVLISAPTGSGKTLAAFLTCLDRLVRKGLEGTLDDRMKSSPARGRVQAKTGWIAGTSALSGIATALDGREQVFSILVNYPDVDGLNTSCWKPMQDEICALLVRSAP